MISARTSLLRAAKQAYSILTNQSKPTGLIVWAADPTTARLIVDQHLQVPYILAASPEAQGTDIQTLSIQKVSI